MTSQDNLKNNDKLITRDCSNKECIKFVNIYKGKPNCYGHCKDESTYMLSTASGYHNKHTNFHTYYFCLAKLKNLIFFIELFI